MQPAVPKGRQQPARRVVSIYGNNSPDAVDDDDNDDVRSVVRAHVNARMSDMAVFV